MSPAAAPKGPAYVVLYFADASDVVVGEDGHSLRYPIAQQMWLLRGPAALMQRGVLDHIERAERVHGGSNGDGGPK